MERLIQHQRNLKNNENVQQKLVQNVVDKNLIFHFRKNVLKMNQNQTDEKVLLDTHLALREN